MNSLLPCTPDGMYGPFHTFDDALKAHTDEPCVLFKRHHRPWGEEAFFLKPGNDDEVAGPAPTPELGTLQTSINIRRFFLRRDADESGVSGPGIVAEGVEYSDGTAVLRWRSHTGSTNVYPNVKAIEAIHGHGGKTSVVWIDYPDDPV